MRSLPGSMDRMFLANVHRKEQYRKEEERVQRGSTLQSCMRKAMVRRQFEAGDEEPHDDRKESACLQLKRRRLAKITRDWPLQQQKLQEEIAQARSKPRGAWKSPLLRHSSQPSSLVLQQEAERLSYSKQPPRIDRKESKVYLNRYFGGFGDFLQVREEEKGWLDRQRPGGVLASLNGVKVYNTIIAEYNELHRLIEMHRSSEQSGFVLLGKAMSGDRASQLRVIQTDAFFFLGANHLQAVFFAQVNRFYQENIRKDSYEMVSRFFNGLSLHRPFEFANYLGFYRLFVLRNASDEEKRQFLLHFLVSPVSESIEIGALKLVFEMLSAKLPGQAEHSTKGRFVQQILLKIMVGNLTEDLTRDFSIVDKEVMRSILARNSEAVELMVTLFYLGPIA